ncbi:MAG: hypothetical protein EPN14_03415 [Gallionella sp.]|nr:MAG: hypothetical protein EPN14_03415 [Gallionella sp.]
MAKQLTDEESNLRRKARRRLIGAIALTLAVVVILPMVLDSQPKPTGQDIDLRIPAPDKVGEFVPGQAVSEVAEALPLAVSTVAVAPVQSAVAQADTVKPVEASGKEPVEASKPGTEIQAQSAVNTPPEPKAVEPKGAEPESADKPASAEHYVTQVGAYSNHNTAKQEADKLKKWGFKVYTEKSGDKIRVRVGPYTEREKAEKVRQLLEKHGVHSVVIGVQ